MFFRRKSRILFRNYESFGYITDNRNFGYKLIDNDENYIGDKILSESGSVFLSVLGRKTQNLDELAKKIQQQFTDVDLETTKNDAREFYCLLEREGFIVSGETPEDCNTKDTRFSYKALKPDVLTKDFYPASRQPDKDTQEFLAEQFNGRPQLTNLHIEITSKCNERCVHCYIPHEYKVNHINIDLFYAVLEQCKEMRLLHLTLSGGEPMLHKEFRNFLRKCLEYDFSVNILSNLTLLNDVIIQEMKENPLLGVQVSLYSMNPNVHDSITQVKGSFEKTKNAIYKLIENDIPLQISCPILKQNKNCSNDVIKWALENKIRVSDDYVIIAGFNHATQNLSYRLSIDEIRDLIKDKAATDLKYFEQLESEAEKKKNTTSSDPVCSVCHSSICIAENGKVYPCAGWQGFTIGNVKDSSLYDIWNNSKKVHYLRGLCKQDFPKCIQCPDKEFCTMCMVRNANESPLGDPLAVNEYFCNIAKLNRKLILEQIEKR